MTNDSTKSSISQPASDTTVYLFDDWFDPIEAGVRDRVRGFIEAMIEGELDSYAETEIGKWRAETAAAKPPVQRRNSRICQPETRARQPTRGNVGGSHTRGNRIVETALAGWGGRIRTHKCASKIGL
jgi:hypothetical protein